MNKFDNTQLVEKLKDKGVLKSENIEKALLEVDRAEFIKKDFKKQAYLDIALPLFDGQTISQPSTIVFMLELLKPEESDRILDIGAGSGYVSAILSKIVGKSGKVFAFEINKKMGEFGLKNIKKEEVSNVKYQIEDAKEGWKSLEPVDKIHSGAAFPDIPDELFQKLKPEGVLVAPTQNGEIRKITKQKTRELMEEVYPGFQFVPFVKNGQKTK